MNNNNNNNEIEIWNNHHTITIHVPNSGDPYDTTTDAFFLEGIPIHGAGTITTGLTSAIYRELFKRGDLTVGPKEECPICMDEYNTEPANNGMEVFPNGFAKCPVKFLCGFICCFDCFWNWVNEKGPERWTCFSCRENHTSALFLRIEEPVTIAPPPSSLPNQECSCHETIKEIFDALESSQRKVERLDDSKGHLRRRVAKLEKTNTELKKQIATLKRKLEVSTEAAIKKTKASKKETLFPSSSSSLDKDDNE